VPRRLGKQGFPNPWFPETKVAQPSISETNSNYSKVVGETKNFFNMYHKHIVAVRKFKKVELPVSEDKSNRRKRGRG
jgi:hypothetical protein